MIPSVSDSRDGISFQPAKRRGVLESQARGRQTKNTIKLTAAVYTSLSSPSWLVWGTPLWTNLDGTTTRLLCSSGYLIRALLQQE